MEIERQNTFSLIPATGSTEVAVIAKRLRGLLNASVLTTHPLSVVEKAQTRQQNRLCFLLIKGNGIADASRNEMRTCISAITESSGRFVLLCDPASMQKLYPFPTDGWCGRIAPGNIEAELQTALPWVRDGRVWCSSTDLNIVLGVSSGQAKPHMPDQAPARDHSKDMELLTPRQREVAELISYGARNEAISDALSISMATVKTHVSNILGILGLRSRTELAVHFRPARKVWTHGHSESRSVPAGGYISE